MAETLDDLVTAVQHAVIEAQKLAEDHHIDLISRFFDEDEETGQVRAVTQEVWVPSMQPGAKDGEHIKIDVPIISLASLGAMKIKELTVEFECRLSSLDTEEDDDKDKNDTPAKTPANKGNGRAQGKGAMWRGKGGRRRRLAFNFKKGADGAEGDSTKAKISITFQGTEPPEGVVRLNDRVLKVVP